MQQLHNLLKRQMKKHLGQTEIDQGMENFIAAVNETYNNFDSDRKLIERSVDISSQELMQSVSLLTATLNATDDGILVVDLNGKVVSYNPNFLKIWDMPEEIIVLREDEKALSYILDKLVDSKAFLDKVEYLYANPEKQGFDTLEFVDGRIIERFSAPQKIGDKIVGRVWSFRDVTNRKQAEENLKNLNSRLKKTVGQLENTNRQLNSFVSIASHDLREPLRKICSFGILLQKSLNGKITSDEAENLGFMIEGSQAMTKMVEGLLAYSRIDSDRTPLQKTDLNEILEHVKKYNFAEKIAEKNVCIQVPKPLPEIWANPEQVKLLFYSIIDNSIKFCGKKCSPHIVIDTKPAAENMVKIEITDNGIGLAPEYHQSVFTMFKRLHGRKRYSGYGVGLALCKEVVEKHNGKIGLESQASQGATFWFTLPRMQVAKTVCSKAKLAV